MDSEKLESLLADLIIEWKYKANKIKTIPGTSGLVYIMENAPATYPQFFAVKTINPEKLSKHPRPGAVARFKRELEHWYIYGHHPLILRPFYIEVIGNWPFVAMPFCEMSMRVLMDTEKSNISERFAIAIQVCHGLAHAKSKGLIAHQDLKPENILLQDLTKEFISRHPIHWHVRISDFGLANAYSEIGIPFGSRPYMAPEQYLRDTNFSKVDIFALGVIFTELFSGYHPIGERTPDIWPEPIPAKGGKWKHERVWKKWANQEEKINQQVVINPESLKELFARMLLNDISLRPELREIENELLSTLKKRNLNMYENVEVVLQYFDKIARESNSLDNALPEQYSQTQIRKFDDFSPRGD